jgi:hypothetical protein
MTTVWLSHGVATPEDRASIQYETDDLPTFLNSVAI